MASTRSTHVRAPHTVRPTGIERPFHRDEIIVSKTDTKGRITYANDVFLRVAGYTEADVVGAPHNLIRHPDMPRAVFQVLWDTIGAGQEIFAYVLNMGADGGHYWVLAHITPTFDQTGRIIGYHSNRRWVSPAVREQVHQVYKNVLDAERAATTTRDAVKAGVSALNASLTQAGHDLGSWVWSLASSDVTATTR